MKSLWRQQKSRAFTLVEMLVVIAIIAVLAALLLPALTRGKQRAQRIQCIGNLKEMGTAFHMFAHDHQGRFPMETPIAEGGSEELVLAGNNIAGNFYFAYRHLQTLANELVVPRILLCPADRDREPALSFGTLQNSNVSYFVGVNADFNVPSSVLAGDRNIAGDANTAATLLHGGYGLHWTSELHFYKGNVLFSDAHVEQMNSPHVELATGTAPGTTIVLPTVKPPGSPSSSGPNPGSGPGSGPNPPPTVAQNPSPSTTSPTAQQTLQGFGAPDKKDRPEPPGRPSPMMARTGTSSSHASADQGSYGTRVFETTAKETNGDTAISAAAPAAAPATDDDEQPPLLWLLGAVKALITKSSWWLLILLAVLLGTALYLYSRRKMRQPRRR